MRMGGADEAMTDVPGKPTQLSEKLVPAPPRARHAPLLLDLTVLLLRGAEIIALAGTSFIVLSVVEGHLFQQERQNYITATFIAILFFVGLSEVTGVHDPDVRFSLRQSWSRLLTAWLSTSMFMLTLSFLLQNSDDYSRVWAVSWFCAGGAALCLTRALGIAWMRSMKRTGVFNQRVAIFGAGSQGNRLAQYILGNDKLTIDLVGFFDARTAERLGPQERVLDVRGNLATLIELIRQGEVDQVIVALPWSAETRLQEVVGELAVTPVRIRLAPDLASFAFAQRALVLLGDLPVMTLFERPISGMDHVIKRLEDLILASFGILLISPFLLFVALAIKLDSKGPVFFRQDREGFNNKHFRIWKFRSMYHHRSEFTDINQATRNDPRITRVGRIIRKLSVDELPQLFNVLIGEMSLVGPRPHAPSTRAGERLFTEVVKTYAARHKVKPGITGWAQVSGWRGETDTEEKLLKRLEHDLFYIENWSLMLDFYILLRTFATVPFQTRAY
jgi:Undecaprenyl-phosphate glucose phosphotransferase